MPEENNKEIKQKSVSDLLRESLKTTDTESLSDKLIAELEGDDKLSLYRFANFVTHTPWFGVILKEVVESQKQFTVMQAANYDEVIFGRATINGALLIKELFEKLSFKYDELTVEEKKQIDKEDPERYQMFERSAPSWE